jgi:hypothetical protein
LKAGMNETFQYVVTHHYNRLLTGNKNRAHPCGYTLYFYFSTGHGVPCPYGSPSTLASEVQEPHQRVPSRQ